MTFGGVKFLLPLNGYGDSLLTPLCLFRAQTVAWNFNGGSNSQTGFSRVCLCVTCIFSFLFTAQHVELPP